VFCVFFECIFAYYMGVWVVQLLCVFGVFGAFCVFVYVFCVCRMCILAVLV